MKSVSRITVGLLALVLLMTMAAAVPASAGEGPGMERIMVQFEPGVKANAMAEIHSKVGAKFEEIIPVLGVQVVTVPEKATSSVLAAYNRHSDVAYAEIDHSAGVIEQTNDPYLGWQWGLSKVQASQAWDVNKGSSSVRVAVLDAGIDPWHPDLSGKIVAHKNFTDSYTPYANGQSHGTHVAGIVAAATNNGVGIAGLGRNTSLMNVKVLGDSGYGQYSWIASGVIWAADNGADVINLSLGSPSYSSTLESAINYAWSKGVLVVAAAGNNGNSGPFYPAGCYYALSVAATDSSDRLASFSNYGQWVDVAAPGVSILSTMPNSSYNYSSGTSMASPHVAGLAGLLYSTAVDTNGNGRVNDEVWARITSTTDPISANIRNGRINAYKAVNGFGGSQPGAFAGTVYDVSTGAAISGATVSAGTRTASTDSSGRYLISSVPAGTYTVTASASAYETRAMNASVFPGKTSTVNFGLNSLNRAPVLSPIGDKAADAGQLLQFTVSATDPDGDSLTYSAGNLPAGSTFNALSRTFSWTPRTDQAGTYPGVTFTVSDGRLSDSEAITITVREAVTTGRILGTVVDSRTGSAIAGARVSDGVRSTITNFSGAYVLSNVPAGSHTVSVSASGYKPVSQGGVTVYAGVDTRMNFMLQPEAGKTMWVDSIKFTPSGRHLVVTVKVVDPQPVGNAYVLLSVQKDGVTQTFPGYTRSDGAVSFTIRFATNGRYTATVSSLVHMSSADYAWDKTKGVVSGSYTFSR
ncbi:MAG: S8 family serine peptidase [Dehalococcoidia bacterium]|nr:S8 family serine peptidase [Dehalococcoidia bacterium]